MTLCFLSLSLNLFFSRSYSSGTHTHRHGLGDGSKANPESAHLIEEIVGQQMNSLVSAVLMGSFFFLLLLPTFFPLIHCELRYQMGENRNRTCSKEGERERERKRSLLYVTAI